MALGVRFHIDFCLHFSVWVRYCVLLNAMTKRTSDLLLPWTRGVVTAVTAPCEERRPADGQKQEVQTKYIQ